MEQKDLRPGSLHWHILAGQYCIAKYEILPGSSGEGNFVFFNRDFEARTGFDFCKWGDLHGKWEYCCPVREPRPEPVEGVPYV